MKQLKLTPIGWYCPKCGEFKNSKFQEREFPKYNRNYKKIGTEKLNLLVVCRCCGWMDKGDPDFYIKKEQKQWKRLYIRGKLKGNLELSPLAILDYEKEEYVPQVGHIVNVAEPPDSNSAWSHAFIGTVKAINEIEGYATVTDMDENAFDIDFIYLTKEKF